MARSRALLDRVAALEAAAASGPDPDVAARLVELTSSVDWDIPQREEFTKLPPPSDLLPHRWYPLFDHPEQRRLWESTARFRVIPAGRRSGKCLAPGQRVAMADGTWKPVEKIRKGEMVLSMTDDYRIEPRRVLDVMSNGLKDTVLVKTTQRTLRCTENHPLLVNNRWTEAGDIQPGDLAAVPRSTPDPEVAQPMEPYLVELLAIWLAEGHDYTISNGTPEVVEIIHGLARLYRCKLRRGGEVDWYFACGHRNGHPMRGDLERFGLWGLNSQTKFIPDEVFRLPRHQLARFLNLFWACDGSVYERRGKGGQFTVCCGLANEHMVRQLSELLLRFGIRCQVRHKIHKARSKRTGKRFESWDLAFSESGAVRRFCQDIGALGKEGRVDAALAGTFERAGSCNEYLPVSVADAMPALVYEPVDRRGADRGRAAVADAPPALLATLNSWRKQTPTRISRRRYRQMEPWMDGRFENLADSGVAWEEVLSVEPAGATWTYDLTVEGCHNFIAEGFVTHNTERAKRFLVSHAIAFGAFPDGRFIAAAPTRDQAREIFWDDLQDMVPRSQVASVSISTLTIRLVNGASIAVVGLDKPARVEGKPIDGIIVDEFGDTKPDAWSRHIRPALSTIGRPGWAWIFGVPRGGRHYKAMYEAAVSGEDPDWDGFHWISADILPEREIEAARSAPGMDPLTFAAEYEASFETATSRVYYAFHQAIHCWPVEYDPSRPLLFCFDFNVEPGVAVVCQEIAYPSDDDPIRICPQCDGRAGETDCVTCKGDGVVVIAPKITAAIDEVWIPTNSNTPRVCGELVRRWKHHDGPVICYGDPAGGARHTSQVKGSDWDIIRDELRPHFRRLHFKVPKKAPAIRSRTAAFNARLLGADRKVRMLINGERCPHLVVDLEDIVPDEHGAPDKKHCDKELSHVSDSAGYFLSREHGLGRRPATSVPIL